MRVVSNYKQVDTDSFYGLTAQIISYLPFTYFVYITFMFIVNYTN